MSIRIRYFASLKEQLGRAEDTLPAAGIASVRQVWQIANPQKAFPDNVLAAVNMEYADWDSAVTDGDEVAFFPPVTGG
jgi:molybdopterin synthase sulfur carrier subunit